jgi:phospholipid/cholesterol/gamma-HCH transport system substrate-binding protein
MENKSHAFAAGLFAIVLTLAIVATVMWFRRDTTVRVPYDVVTHGSVTGLGVNAPVRYRGLPVGRVSTLGFDPAKPEDIVVRILVNETTPITRSTEASMGLQGVTGTAFLQLDEHGNDRTRLVTSDDHVARIPMRAGMLEQLQHRGDALIGQIESLTASLQRFTDDDSRKQFLATANSIQRAADGVNALTARAGPAVDQLPHTLQELDRTLASTNQLVSNLNRPDGPFIGTLNRIGSVADRASATLDDVATRVSYDTLPRVNALSDDVRTATRSVTRAADTISQHPRSLLFGAPSAPPGPGEPGFSWPAQH